MRYTRSRLADAIAMAADEIMEDHRLQKGIGVGGDLMLCLMLVDDKSDEGKYTLPGKVIEIALREGFQSDLSQRPVMEGTQPLYIRDGKSVSRVAEYFAYKLGIED